jgi:hypothetical protein
MTFDPGPGQPYGCGSRLDKDAGEQFERAAQRPEDIGGVEERRPTPNASDSPEQEPAEVD